MNQQEADSRRILAKYSIMIKSDLRRSKKMQLTIIVPEALQANKTGAN
jgi:hypothetical protein